MTAADIPVVSMQGNYEGCGWVLLFFLRQHNLEPHAGNTAASHQRGKQAQQGVCSQQILGCAGQRRMSSMGYLGMISVPIPRLRTESADADEVSLLFFPFINLLSAVRLVADYWRRSCYSSS